MDPLIDSLCLSCGLCCDGVLFSSVICSTATEARRMKELGSPIESHEGLAIFPQPCAHLHGTRCRVYAERPGRCRQFECELLKAVRRGEATAEAAGAIIAETRAAAAQLRSRLLALGDHDTHLPLARRCARITDAPSGRSAEWWDEYAEFLLLLRRVQALLRQHFYESLTSE